MDPKEQDKAQQERILNALEKIVATAKDISDDDQTLGEILLFFITQTMDLYEALVKQEQYNIKALVHFVSRLYDLPERTILTQSYGSGNQAPIKCDDALVDAIVKNSGEADLEGYRDATAKLVTEFKSEARAMMGR